MSPVIVASDVSFYAGGKRILRGVDFSGGSGEFIGLLGPNGAGKSTLLRILAGLIAPSAGTVGIGGQDLRKMQSIEVARKVAYVPQDTHVAFDFSVWEIVLMGRHPHVPRFAMEGERDHEIAARRWGASAYVIWRIVRLRVCLAENGRWCSSRKPWHNSPEFSCWTSPFQPWTSAISCTCCPSSARMRTAVRRRSPCCTTSTWRRGFADRVYIMADGQIAAQGRPDVVYTKESLARTYGVRAVVRYDPLVKSPTVTALDELVESETRSNPNEVTLERK